MEQYYSRSIDAVKKDFNIDSDNGLSSNDREERLKKDGENRLATKKQNTILELFLNQFKDFLVIILLIATVVSLSIGHVEDGIIIFAIVILNAVLGVYQENKASNALKALQDMSSPTAKIIVDGHVREVSSTSLVVGDVVLIETGDYIPADIRLLDSTNLKVEEAALTGESVAVEKDAKEVINKTSGIGDIHNCCFMSTIVTYGRAKGVVIATGMNTQIGHIATMLEQEPVETTPLQKKLDAFGKKLGIICIAVCIAIFGLGLFRGIDLIEIFMTAISTAVAAIPEGLTVVVTVILALGMQRMVKSNAIIKRLSAVETLGSTTVICSDKTGTLTQNKMTVVSVFDNQEHFPITGTGYEFNGTITDNAGNPIELSKQLKELVEGMALCNDAKLDLEEKSIIGDPTEGALIVLAGKLNVEQNDINQKYPRVNEIAFDSDRKLMSTIHQHEKNEQGMPTKRMYTKGAPDVVLNRSTKVLINNQIFELTSTLKEKIMAANENYAKQALRVLALAYKDVTFNKETEDDLIFVGLVGMIDPPRPEVIEAIKVCKKAGIGVKMITGDHKITALAIAKQIGIINDNGQALEGKELDLLSDKELQQKVKTTNVYARVSPVHKVKLVEAIKANNEIVAMTGDGVNDAPALKRADIGIAMGITGTDVSKEAADMILTDDNFASIVKAVEEGRTIYDNIRKVIGYLLSCNIGEIILIFFAMVFGWPIPLVAIQILSINLVTDAFPAFALGMEEKEANVMDRKPRLADEPLIDRKMANAITIQSIALGFASLFSFWFTYNYTSNQNVELARTCCFVTLVLGELIRAYAARHEEKSIFEFDFLSNKMLNNCTFFSIVFLIVIIYIPFFQPIFKTVAPMFKEILVPLLLAFLPLIGTEFAKIINKKLHK